MSFLRKVLLQPFAWLFGSGVLLRNELYQKGVYRSVQFDVPSIGIGNLSVGGTGKTQLLLYLARHLREDYSVHSLSRGYGRKTHGFRQVKTTSTASEVGDEALMIKWLLQDDITVAVSEDRVMGVPELLRTDAPNPVLLFDDVFQHRAVQPGLQILLTTYAKPYWEDDILPLGRLREPASSAKRADIIVVTKCPKNLSEEEQASITKAMKPAPWQKVFFASQQYGSIYRVFKQPTQPLSQSQPVLMLTGIANPEPLEMHLKEQFSTVYTRTFPDHHRYRITDLESIETTRKDLGDNTVIITTEKDIPRLAEHKHWIDQHHWSVYVQPVRMQFLPARPAFETVVDYYLAHPEQNEIEDEHL